VMLSVRTRGKRKRKLSRFGKVGVNAQVTYTPIGADAISKATGIRLVKRRPPGQPCFRFCATGRPKTAPPGRPKTAPETE
jgi:hypothetical protein